MKGSRFDVWTRRQFGLAAGGIVASLLGSLTRGETEAKKNRRKPRCKKLGRLCTPGGTRKCCGDLRCRTATLNAVVDTFCCKTEGQLCEQQSHCCGDLCCSPSGLCSSICYSDRALKANFGSVDPADMLQRVRDLPISTWNYASDDPAVRHIGPMAQDFAALFGVGADDRHIHPIDGQGVALAAIQGLLAEVELLREAHALLTAHVVRLEAKSS